ncbi:MAG: PEP-CTERM sorting domain-containing protein [Chitinophagaceae bacterium]|nr:PEP-CTERM sorting domain-containing protein [Rubrivivax sp.]
MPFIGPPLLGPLARNAGAFSYSVDAGTGELRAGFRSGAIFGGENQIWLETFRTQDTLIFADFSSGVVGLGGNFFNTSFGGSVGAGAFGAIRINATDADGTVTRTLGNTSLSSFLGVVSNTGSLSSVTAQSLRFDQGLFTSAAVDNLILATAVPEAETYALLLAGLAGVAFRARRRRG